jgi:CRP-like cAMP-binding protein
MNPQRSLGIPGTDAERPAVLLPVGVESMATRPASTAGNRLLEKMPESDRRLLEPHLVREDLPVRKDLEKPNKRIDSVFFIEAGIASVVAIQRNGTHVEIGIIGCEGVTGAAVVLGDDRTPYSTYMQVGGRGLRINAEPLREAMRKSDSLHAILLKSIQAFMLQTSHTAVANARGSIHVRLARWLLMAHDRLPGAELPLTHEFLSMMLAVRRPGVTEAINVLKRDKLIDAARGSIVVRNRKGLEKIAANFYGVPEAEYRRLMS